jgi:titin
VERLSPHSKRWTKVVKQLVSELTLSVADLEEGGKYQFRVSAENEAGVGNPCEPITVLAKDPFGECCEEYILLCSIFPVNKLE